MIETLWTPSSARTDASRLTAFVHELESNGLGPFPNYESLHAWSVDRVAEFWLQAWDHLGLIGSPPDPARVLVGDDFPTARWFEGVELNFAENLLRGDDDRVAVIFEAESAARRRELTLRELRSSVARARRGLKSLGISAGDRVAAWMPNLPETLVVMLAASSLGAVFSSCSPDFGVDSVFDRFGQIAPRVLFVADGYTYNGRVHGLGERVRHVVDRIDAIEQVVVVPYDGPPIDGLPHQIDWHEFLGSDTTSLEFDALPFDHPLYLLYTSGTTGVPKCLLHAQGRILLKHAQEHALQLDVRAGDVVFYFTTCGWMMWNWLVTALAQEATIVLYDGSPVAPTASRLFELIERNRITLFGTSPRFLAMAESAGLNPGRDRDLSSLRTVTSAGAPLNPEQFRWVYERMHDDVHLVSISGGTDLCGCFVGGAPGLPVRAGEIQCSMLGMKTECFDDDGRPLIGEKGELVCTRLFPSVPLGFWNDPDGSRFRAAYFDRFPGAWHHGDFIEITPDGGCVIYGRSDATLNPGGVRIGTAELYRQAERLDEVVDVIAATKRVDGDDGIALFVVLASGVELTEELKQRLRRTIREGASPRHVPREIHAVREIPRTISGKPVELAVAAILRGQEVKNRDALANPEALDQFENFR